MFTNTKSIYAGQDKVYTESVCLSTDVKPTTGIANGSVCLEMNTGKKFMFNEDSGEWVEVPSSGGGGGGDSDFSTAQVTVTGMSSGIVVDPLPVLIIDGELITDKPDSASVFVLYKGSQRFVITEGISTIESVEGSGGVSVNYDEEYQEYVVTVTGDGTLSIINHFD